MGHAAPSRLSRGFCDMARRLLTADQERQGTDELSRPFHVGWVRQL